MDGSQKILVRKSIAKIQSYGMEVGQPLKGELSGCRKLKHKKAGLRIVFRESKKGLEIIQVIAIGKRENQDVYHAAADRIK
ncbi:hypothetical protein APE02nite_23120 [Alkalibacterium pelagium]|nr:hypothetical protein APE02nite_23120 [Alkalibacterium pelagium]